MTPFAKLEKAAQARWRSVKNMEALWHRLGIKKDVFSDFGNVGMARSKHVVADTLQGPRLDRMGASLGRAVINMRLPAAPNFMDGAVVFRGVNPTEQVRDLFFGGGYYGGAVLHGSPQREVARSFGNITGSGGKLNVMSVFEPHKMQTYGHNYSVESLLEHPQRQIFTTHNPTESDSFETAISSRHNRPLGALIEGPDKVKRFVDPADTKSIKAVSNLLSELGKRGGPSQTKYIHQGGVERVSSSRVDNLFKWQPGSPESQQDTVAWLDGLSAKLKGPIGVNFDKLKTLMGA